MSRLKAASLHEIVSAMTTFLNIGPKQGTET